MKQHHCRTCQNIVAAGVKKCPQCGETNPALSQNTMRNIWIISAVIVIGFMLYFMTI